MNLNYLKGSGGDKTFKLFPKVPEVPTFSTPTKLLYYRI